MAAIIIGLLSDASVAAGCDYLSGRFNSIGAVESGEARITFLQAMRRPSRSGVQAFRLDFAADGLIVQLLAADGSIVGSELNLRGACLDGRWVESSSYDGSGDGTRVKGTRTWKYSRAADGALLVEFSEVGDTYYLPGVPTSRSASGVWRFEQRIR